MGVRSKPDRKSRIGIVSPRTGAPSIISNFVIVSLSLYWFGAEKCGKNGPGMSAQPSQGRKDSGKPYALLSSLDEL